MRPMAMNGIGDVVLYALSVAVRNLPDVELKELPYMADFAKMAAAAEPAIKLDDVPSFAHLTRSSSDGHFCRHSRIQKRLGVVLVGCYGNK
jgi:hypothetical protein